MRHAPAVLMLTLCITATLSGVANAATNPPPIKPGLWEVRSEREIDGQKAPDPMTKFKELPPEARARMEAVMKERGIDMSAASGGAVKLCLDKASLDAGQWQQADGKCQTTYTTQDSVHWQWHSTCADSATEIDGEARFIDSEHYTVNATMKTARKGAARTMQVKTDSRWQGADCGSVVPINKLQTPVTVPAGR